MSEPLDQRCWCDKSAEKREDECATCGWMFAQGETHCHRYDCPRNPHANWPVADYQIRQAGTRMETPFSDPNGLTGVPRCVLCLVPVAYDTYNENDGACDECVARAGQYRLATTPGR